MLTKEQHEFRAGGIGASEIASVCGLNPYKAALAIYLDKQGLTEHGPETQASEWGTRLEEAIAKKYAQTHGVEIRRPEQTYRHPGEGWMLATPDGLVCRNGSRLHGLEVKTAGLRQAFRWGEEGDAVPEEYLVQCAWSMAVLNLNRWDLAVLIGGQDYREYRIDRDLELEARLIEIGREFWFEHVVTRIPPAPDASESAARALARIYPKDALPLRRADSTADACAVELREAQAQLAKVEKTTMLAENKAKALIGGAAGLEGDWGRITWKRSKPFPVVDWQAVADELKAPAEMVTRHTTERAGSRRFVAKFKEN